MALYEKRVVIVASNLLRDNKLVSSTGAAFECLKQTNKKLHRNETEEQKLRAAIMFLKSVDLTRSESQVETLVKEFYEMRSSGH